MHKAEIRVTTQGGTGLIRRYEDADASEVCALHRRVFLNGLPEGTTADQFRDHMRDFSVGNPWHTDSLGSLVLEDVAGKIRGFICVVPRRYLLQGRPVLGAVCSTMCIDKEYQGYSGALLLRRALEGPQDFSISDDATDLAAQIAVYSGWTVHQLPSIRWTVPIRPAGLVISSILNRSRLQWARGFCTGIASTLDSVARQMQYSPVKAEADEKLIEQPMDIDAMALALPRICRGFSLRVDYDRESLRWMLRRARRMRHAGEPRMSMVCEKDGSVAGWFVYYLQKQGLGDVVQFTARRPFRKRVFNLMVRDAWQHGGAGLTGRLDPDLMEIVPNMYCLFQPPPHWVLFSSRDQELAKAVFEGRAFLSRLDGEWAHHFPTGSTETH